MAITQPFPEAPADRAAGGAARAAAEAREEAAGAAAEAAEDSRLKRMLVGLVRLASLQSRILLLRSKMMAGRLVAFAVFLMIAGATALAGLVFLYIAIFRFIAAEIGSTWTFLIFGIVHVIAALIFYAIARAKLKPPTIHRGPAQGVSS